MSVVAPRGFAAGGAHLGIKAPGVLDGAVVAVTGPVPVPAAAVFTTNLAAAAPVTCSREHLAATGGVARAVVVTSGNANAATGAAGREAAMALCTEVAGALGARREEVLVAQTGLIGIPFDPAGALAPLRGLCGALGTTPAHGEAAATAILTTDTHRKTHVERAGAVTVGAMAKGAGMLAPNLATMLVVATTDAACDPGRLKAILAAACAPTFNSLIVDGDTSTNDTVAVLASGEAGPVADDVLGGALEATFRSLCSQLAEDAEGSTRTATVHVTSARSDAEAHAAARAVASSLLVKCSINGADPYWGRIVAALGRAGTDFVLDKVRVAYGDVVVCEGGERAPHDPARAIAAMSAPHVELRCDLGLGDGRAAVLCCDLSEAYVEENRRTS